MGTSQTFTIRDVIRDLVGALETPPCNDFCAEFSKSGSSKLWVQVVRGQINFHYPFKTHPDDQLRGLPVPPLASMRCSDWGPSTSATYDGIDLNDVEWLSRFVDGLFTTLYALGPDYKLDTDIIEL